MWGTQITQNQSGRFLTLGINRRSVRNDTIREWGHWSLELRGTAGANLRQEILRCRRASGVSWRAGAAEEAEDGADEEPDD